MQRANQIKSNQIKFIYTPHFSRRFKGVYSVKKHVKRADNINYNNYNVYAEQKAIRSALQTISNDCNNYNPPCVNNIVIFTDSQSAIQAIAQMHAASQTTDRPIHIHTNDNQ